MIRVNLSEDDQLELERYRGQASSKNSEKAFMILLNSRGKSAVKVGDQLNRNPHSVRKWLKSYIANGLSGLDRLYSGGRPREKREECVQIMETVLSVPPQEFKYPDQSWSIPLLKHHLKRTHKIDVSEDTLGRGLKDLGYSYKRPSKSVSPKAPNSEEKKKAIAAMIESIEKLLKEKPCEIFASDESHFSTEPYLVKGWFKKRWPPSDSQFSQQRKLHHVWVLKFKESSFLLEEIKTV